VARACPATFVSAMSTATAFGLPVKRFGVPAQQEKYLPGVVRGDFIGGLACTEADAGSDLAGIRATAGRKGSNWDLNGSKYLVTNAPIADALLVLAWTDHSAGLDKGLTFFIMEKGTKGLAIGPPLETMGLRGALISEITFDGCELGGDAVLGHEVGHGFAQFKQVMEYVKLALSAMSVGLGVACMADSTTYAKSRKAFGKPIGLFEGVGAKLATMFTANDLGRMLAYRAAWAMEQQDPESPVLTACAKLFSSESVNEIADLAMQVYGGHGYLKGSTVERLYRDARYAVIAYGTSEMQRAAIAKDSLDKYNT
jgi:alkylation response protein AidB-like acyl-CoA dehydrogenase